MCNVHPGDRFQLNEISGNAGRKGFVLYQSNTDSREVMVRFDYFAYNSITKLSYITILEDEPFRTKEDQENGT